MLGRDRGKSSANEAWHHAEWAPVLIFFVALVVIGVGIGGLVVVTKLLFWAMGWG